MSFRRALSWMMPPLALFALVAWLARAPLAERPKDETAAAQGAGMVPVVGPAVQPPSAAGPDRLAAVQKLVAQKNAESAQQKEAVVQAGWHLDTAAPPDPQLLALDPSLLNGREADLRTQLSSTSASPDQAANLGEIARKAHESATQIAAIEALGRIRSDGAQDQLEGLLKELPADSFARREVAPLLRPRDLSDERAARLAQLLDSRDLNPVEKQQIAFTLSLVGLRDQSQLPQAVQGGLSMQARALLARTSSLATFDRSSP